ncbi:hypothetical protein CC85DRAFT_329264 [Cutaneotrichosporon oleaginosum]|uniref:sterol 3beta-glucosyltransferase n=1 Tax=Cutaneotrichosporon oleaginosum TaxID=879819 RepID=A0A0J1B0M3_9TREE|nr:uncharacterized protein CC85DRAFT_329264 [Cutaneotrichosporon oleaginosum]KLT41159.1 hypothetical protein CC85DRAFT_329264 [Cutaneotrichosporon oleaginosum]TXT14123.1 hypothetical protein COLE_00316 [Cutaneotrichosporon oleaginosum]
MPLNKLSFPRPATATGTGPASASADSAPDPASPPPSASTTSAPSLAIAPTPKFKRFLAKCPTKKGQNSKHKRTVSDEGLGHVQAGTASSCQLFCMFEAMAAGARGITGAGLLEVEEDEVEVDSRGGVQVEVETAQPMGEGPPDDEFHDADEFRDTDSLGHEKIDSEDTPDEDKKYSFAQWIRAEHEDTGAKLTALSMNTLNSSFASANASSSTVSRPGALRRPSYRPNHLYDTDDESVSTAPTSEQPLTPTASTPTTPKSAAVPSLAEEKDRFSRNEYNEADKLQAIIDEFGDIASKMVDADGQSEPERILAESQGTLFKGVMMIGNLHLTTHRLLFHALLPPDSAFMSPSEIAEPGDDGAVARPNIIYAGPVTVHRSNLYKPKQRVWLELSPEMITTYPSGDEKSRVRPLFSILLSTVLRLMPFDDDHPTDFVFTYDSADGERTTHFTVDNEQSAITWRRYFESALFRYSRRRFRDSHMRDSLQGVMGAMTHTQAVEGWSMLRCCVPLDRARVAGVSEYHSFATLVKMDIRRDDAAPETSEGNFAGLKQELPEFEVPRRAVTEDGGRRRSRFLPSLSRSRDSSRERTKEKRGSGQFSSPLRAETAYASSQPAFDPGSISRNKTYIDAAPPPRLDPVSVEDDDSLFDLVVGVLNEQAWFVQVLEPAFEAARERQYKAGVTPAKFTIDVGGYDCLAKDDDIEARRDRRNSGGSESSMQDDDEEAGRPLALIEARKREKAAMAARVFGLREDEGIWLKRCYIGKVAPARGHIILTPRYICFWRRANVGADIKYRFAVRDVKGAEAAPSTRIRMHGLDIHIHGQEDLHFEFWKKTSRDMVVERINELVRLPTPPGTGTQTPQMADFPPDSASEASSAQHSIEGQQGPVQMWQQVRGMKLEDKDFEFNPALGTASTLAHAAKVLAPPPDLLLYPKAMSDEALSYMPFVANRPWQVRTGWNTRLTPRRFTMLTIGSRGDVQPYIALALRLMEDGHKCVIVTHDEFKTWIESYGIEHRQAGGDPTALMKLSTDHAMFSPGFFKEALGGFRRWLDELLVDSWNACQDADVLIESPSAMAGVHIAEGLAKKSGKPVPYFRAFTMPWTRTSAYPQAFMVPQIEMGPSFNYSTYVLFDNIMWRASSGQINRWRKKYLGLRSTDQESLSINKVPFLYNFSPAVVPKPLDWDDAITITGYWNLENSDMDWSPPPSLDAFMAQAKADGKPLVYIGFGSIIVPDPAAVTKSIVKGVEKAGVRAIIAKGWSGRDKAADAEDDEPLPASCYSVDKVPHGWLFPKLDAAMHHGGAGTTGASLRAGIPTLIKPWFGDQHFWALRVAKLGVGAKVSSLRSDDIADALTKATTSRVMVEKAARIGERIRAESGVDAAVQAIHYNIVRAARDRRRLRKQDNAHGGARMPVGIPKRGMTAPTMCTVLADGAGERSAR